MKRGAIVLAAGAGARMGAPKVRLVVETEPLISMHVARFGALSCDPIVVATREDCAPGVRALASTALTLTMSTPDPAATLAAAYAGAPAADVWIVTPVDALPCSKPAIESLFAAIEGGARAAVPAHEGKSGHPVVCCADVLEVYREGAPRPLRDVLADLGAARVVVPVDDMNVRSRLDSPADVMAWTGAAPRFW